MRHPHPVRFHRMSLSMVQISLGAHGTRIPVHNRNCRLPGRRNMQFFSSYSGTDVVFTISSSVSDFRALCV